MIFANTNDVSYLSIILDLYGNGLIENLSTLIALLNSNKVAFQELTSLFITEEPPKSSIN